MGRTQARRDNRGRTQSGPDQRDLRQAILDATEQLLAERRFDELSVNEILAKAKVSRASFYFYFESKHAVLAELVNQAVRSGHELAQPYLNRSADDSLLSTLQHGIVGGARLWREKAPVLKAIVENWQTDETLSATWSGLMESYTTATADRIEHDRHNGLAPQSDVDSYSLASSITWLVERCYYLAAIDVPPFNDEQKLVELITGLWLALVYGRPAFHALSED